MIWSIGEKLELRKQGCGEVAGVCNAIKRIGGGSPSWIGRRRKLRLARSVALYIATDSDTQVSGWICLVELGVCK